MRAQQGFSLVELMVALAVLVILVTVAIPSFNGSLLRAKASGLANSLITTLNYARSEAITRNQRVSICAANATEDGCLNAAADWNRGWVILDAANQRLRVVRVTTVNAQIAEPSHSAKRLQFKSDGELVLLDGAGVETQAELVFSTQITHCDDPQLNIRTEIRVAVSGLITVSSRQACNL